MAQTINLPNYDSPNLRQRTLLQSDHLAAVSSLIVENSDGFVTGYSALIGQPGSETAELIAVSSAPDSTHVSLASPTAFPHLANAPVTLLYGSSMQVYRAPNVDGTAPASSEFAAVGSPVTITPDALVSSYTDATGGSSWWYRFTYVGQSGETSLDDCPAVRGGNAGVYCSLTDIREAAGFENAPYVTDAMISGHRAAAQSYIDGSLSGKYVVPFADPVNPQIIDITKRLAAGYLMIEQYPSSPDRGKAKIDSAMADLKMITDGQVVLLNSAGVTQEIDESIIGDHFPDGDAGDNPAPGDSNAPRYFHMVDVVNNYNRKY